MDTELSSDFIAVMENRFQARYGPAYEKDASYCNSKLCFVATDQDFLRDLLLDLSRDPDCYFVKYDTNPRDGMYRGRCFYISLEKVGQTWARYKMHPKVICTVQNDDVTGPWRNQVRDWSEECDGR